LIRAWFVRYLSRSPGLIPLLARFLYAFAEAVPATLNVPFTEDERNNLCARTPCIRCLGLRSESCEIFHPKPHSEDSSPGCIGGAAHWRYLRALPRVGRCHGLRACGHRWLRPSFSTRTLRDRPFHTYG